MPQNDKGRATTGGHKLKNRNKTRRPSKTHCVGGSKPAETATTVAGLRRAGLRLARPTVECSTAYRLTALRLSSSSLLGKARERSLPSLRSSVLRRLRLLRMTVSGKCPARSPRPEQRKSPPSLKQKNGNLGESRDPRKRPLRAPQFSYSASPRPILAIRAAVAGLWPRKRT